MDGLSLRRTVGWVDSAFSFPINGYVIQSGDKLHLMQKQVNIQAGFQFNTYQGGTTCCSVTDMSGDNLNQSAAAPGVWNHRVVDLGPFTGQSLWAMKATITTTPPANTVWDVYYRDIVIVSTDGSVHPIYTANMSPTISQSGVEGQTDLSASVDMVANASADTAGTHYYIGDHLRTTQEEFSAGGYPVWKGEFAPFGQELDTQTTGNHYKFTGKERDAESGNDYFGARYYGSNVGRFMSPDWSDSPEPVPYAKLANPQSLNLYAYVGNNPMTEVDLDGHVDGAASNQGNADVYSWWSCAQSELCSGEAALYGRSPGEPAPSPQKPAQQQNAEGSNSNVDKRNALADAAYGEAKGKSTAWAQGNGAPKCNVFVCAMLNKAGIGGPTYPGGDNPLVAQDWANPKFHVDNWRVLGPGEAPGAGDVAAYKESFSNATGHSGIVTGNDNGVIHVVAAGSTSIYQTTAGSKYFGQGMVITYRRYTGQ